MAKMTLRGALTVLLLLTLLISHPSIGGGKSKAIYRGQVAVVMYHHIADDNNSSSTITTKLFREHLTGLKNRGYKFIDLEAFKAYMAGGPVVDNAVFVTFDDGYDSYYHLGLPIMKELGVPSINFLITTNIEKKKTIGIPAMTPETVRKLKEEYPQAHVGSHTHKLHDKKDGRALLTRLKENGGEETTAKYEARVKKDLDTSVKLLKELDPDGADMLAYPFGIFNKSVIKLVKASGFHYGFTISPGMTTHRTDPLSIPRINLGNPTITPEQADSLIRKRIVSKFGQ
jgi:peptidoglycan/xylan/chitin deacetylase (PgdA/CDA1 family)